MDDDTEKWAAFEAAAAVMRLPVGWGATFTTDEEGPGTMTIEVRPAGGAPFKRKTFGPGQQAAAAAWLKDLRPAN